MINALLETSSQGRLLDGFAGPAAESHRSPRDSAAGRWPMFEPLEARVLLSVTLIDLPALAEAPPVAEIHKLIVAGDPSGDPADSPGDRVDENTNLLYGGVGSLRVDATGFDGYIYIGSATAISPTHVLTAAHMLDLNDDGDIDVAPSDVTFNLNFGSDLSHVIIASAFYVHPDFTGFGSPSINDDVAVIELSSELPEGVPFYALNTDSFVNIETVTLVGYGLSGDGVDGYDYDLGTSWSVKRVGSNRAEVYISDDEGSGSREGWELDFDGLSKKTNLFGTPRGSNLTLGNDIETTLGGGDSGGPAFIGEGSNLEIFGINTFGFTGKAPAPLFGSGAGGIVVAPYVDWINSVMGGGAIVDTEAPTVPSDLVAAAVSENRIDLTWTASTDNVAVTGYNIFRDDVQVGTSSTVNFSDTGLLPSTTYVYTVAAFDAAGNTSNLSDSAGATTLAPDTEAPTIPGGLTATAVSGAQIDLAWTASTDNVAVTGYNIFRDEVQVGTSSTVNFSDTGLQPSTTYVYTVSAFDATGNTSGSASADATTLDQAADEGFVLSKDGGFSSDDREFSTADTLYIKIWSNSVDFNNVKKAEYKIEDANRRKTQGKLTNNFDGTYTASISLSGLALGTAKVNIKIEDTSKIKFEVKDEFITIVAAATSSGREADNPSPQRIAISKPVSLSRAGAQAPAVALQGVDTFLSPLGMSSRGMSRGDNPIDDRTVLYPDATAPAPLPTYSTIAGSRQSPRPQLVDLVSGAFEDAPADDESAVEMDLDLRVLGAELLDKLVPLL